jgi:hypothetical protein
MWRFTSETKDKTIKKWAAHVHPHTRDLIRLRVADRKGNKAKDGRPAITFAMKCLLRKLVKFEKEGVPVTRMDLAINGDDLIELKIRPGPGFKHILKDCLELVLEDQSYNTRDFLRGYVTGRFKRR